ncbi:hypothetical protein ACWD0A_23645 [Streptomyces sp. NPDC002867]
MIPSGSSPWRRGRSPDGLAGAVGGLLGAAVTPRVVRRIGSARAVLYATVFLR